MAHSHDCDDTALQRSQQGLFEPIQNYSAAPSNNDMFSEVMLAVWRGIEKYSLLNVCLLFQILRSTGHLPGIMCFISECF